MPETIREGMSVIDSEGQRVGAIARIVVGGETREPRFLVIERDVKTGKDYRFFPWEAIAGVESGALRLGVTMARLDLLPRFHRGPPTPQEARAAFEAVGGTARGDRYSFENLPFEQAERIHSRPDAVRRLEERADRASIPDYSGTVERYLLLSPEERREQGISDEWTFPSHQPLREGTGGSTANR